MDRHATLFPTVPPVGTSEQRWGCSRTPSSRDSQGGPVHIIAHSMGGLDSRILIARNHHGLANPGRIASLTTLSTPHRGKPGCGFDRRPKAGRRTARDIQCDPTSHRRTRHSDRCARQSDHGKCLDGAGRGPDVSAYSLSFVFRGRTLGHSADVLRPRAGASVHAHGDGVAERRRGGIGFARYGEFQQPSWPCDHVDMVGTISIPSTWAPSSSIISPRSTPSSAVCSAFTSASSRTSPCRTACAHRPRAAGRPS